MNGPPGLVLERGFDFPSRCLVVGSSIADPYEMQGMDNLRQSGGRVWTEPDHHFWNSR